MTKRSAPSEPGWIIALTLACVAPAVGQDEARAVEAEVGNKAGVQAFADGAKAHSDPTVDRILSRLENRHIGDLRAKVAWTVTDAIVGGEGTTKRGRIWYKDMKPVAQFKVHFDKQSLQGRKYDLNEQHLFDGRWYIELRSENKMVSQYELRREGEVGDPYRVGEGLFPLPFGQKKADILAEFEVALVPSTMDGGEPANSDHLMLTPKPGSNTGVRYTRVDFWVQRTGKYDGLPLKVRSYKKDGTGKANQVIDIEFTEAELETGFSNSELRIEPPRDYHVEKIPLPASSEGESGP